MINSRIVGKVATCGSSRFGLVRTTPIGRRLQSSFTSNHAPSNSTSSSTPIHKEYNSRQVSVERELPDPFEAKRKNRMYFVAYGIGITLSCAIIFNYEKTRSPVINSVLYCLRRSEQTRELLGGNIDFKSSWPWIWGELNTMHGKIDIEFRLRGDKNEGTLKLKAMRESKLHPFDVQEWKLCLDDGRELDLTRDTSVEFGL